MPNPLVVTAFLRSEESTCTQQEAKKPNPLKRVTTNGFVVTAFMRSEESRFGQQEAKKPNPLKRVTTNGFVATAPMWVQRSTLMIAIALVLSLAAPLSADTVEFLSGAKLEGKVTNIDKAKKEINFEAKIGSRILNRTYSYSQIHAVTLGDKRYVLNAKADDSGTGNSQNPAGKNDTTVSGTDRATNGSTNNTAARGRTRMQVQAYIKQVGTTPPPWYENAPLNHPGSLDLAWPKPPPKKWNNQQNVGQYIWDVINPNQNKWQHGVKFMHHLMQVNKDNPEVLRRSMNEIGRMYHDLHEDYARAAFWWQKAGLDNGRADFGRSSPHLAACYYRLGNKQMAVELLNKIERTGAPFPTIKVWAEVGEVDRALRLAELFARSNPDLAYLYAGDACRTTGKYQQAISYYNKAIAAPDTKRSQRNKDRARANIAAIRYFELSDVAKVPDGTYSDQAKGYEAPVRVEVVVKDHRIESVRVTQHREKQYYSAISDTPAKIIAKQGVKGVDATSSATITSEAIINATAKALADAAQ